MTTIICWDIKWEDYFPARVNFSLCVPWQTGDNTCLFIGMQALPAALT